MNNKKLILLMLPILILFLLFGLYLNNKVQAACPGVCLDFDGDGYGSPASAVCSFSLLDCDDTDSAVNVGSAEGPGFSNCNDGSDNDCNGQTDCDDPACTSAPSCALSCVPDGCNANCPVGCSALDDPDCSGSCMDCTCATDSDCASTCAGGDGCCVGCASDPDCAPSCIVDGCNNNCPTGCTALQDPDCLGACLDNTCPTDTDCPPVCIDDDGDGYGDPASATCLYSLGDCDDTPLGADGISGTPDDGVNIYPGATDVCDGLDNDCDSLIDENDTEETCQYVCKSINILFDWNDTIAYRTGERRCCGDDASLGEGTPFGLPESVTVANCSDGIDNDCDGTCDMVNDACFSGSLPDSDCTGSCTNASEDNYINVATPGVCNQCTLTVGAGAIDNDGDQPGTWPPDKVDLCDDDCGVVSTLVTLADFELNEVTCGDGLDNDCDGVVDDGLTVTYYLDSDGDGEGNSVSSVVACPPGPIGPPAYVTNSDDCDDSDPTINHSATEVCADSLDNDCDSLIDEGCTTYTYYRDFDADGCGNSADSLTTSLTVPPTGYVLTTAPSDCDDTGTLGSNYKCTGFTETCDNLDNDCDTIVDEGCDDDNDDYCDSAIAFYYINAMGTGVFTCLSSVGSATMDCNDSNAFINVTATEDCNDGVDNDCDALIDCVDVTDCLASPFCSASCTPDGCNGVCPSGCSSAQDPDCVGACMDCTCSTDSDCVATCSAGDGCCTGCGVADPDCVAVCVPDGCNGTCPSGCSGTDDPDCAGACMDCTCSTDTDCASTCSAGDGCCTGCGVADPDCGCVFPFLFPCSL